jgi:all-trans-retinol 13,14-reductase
MVEKNIKRREFLKSVLASTSILALDWDSFPKGLGQNEGKTDFDAVIIGSGLGGLSCAAAFARQGFKPLVLEQHYVPGGYATTFKRPGGFVFDVSLHSTSVTERERLDKIIPGFPEIKDIEYIPHPNLYHVIFPDYDIRVPQKDLQGYINLLVKLFPEEKEGIEGIFEDMKGLGSDISKYSAARGKINMNTFAQDYPYLTKSFGKTWGTMLDARIKNIKLKAIISALWGYYGLPPSKLSSLYYAMATISYLQQGGYYIKGTSQKMSNAMKNYIEERGGKVMLRTRVEKILTKDHAAYGVQTADKKVYTGKVVVSNANAYDTFHRMLDEGDYLKDYLSKMDRYNVSLSSFQVFLGLKKDIVGELGIKDTEVFYATGYDMEEGFRRAVNAEVENGGYGLMLYDNLYQDYSPKGKNTITLLTLQGYDHWKKYEADYFKGNKDEYRKEKERIADVLIRKAEKNLLPGLSKAIEVKEIGTPLTNVRYTSNYRGAIYGWDQTIDNSAPNRIPHVTPIKNLYLAGAWTNPGGGYGAVLPSGLECFGLIMKDWK